MDKWSDCTHDIEVYDDDGNRIYKGPKFLRCNYGDCGELVTHGQLELTGTCVCGGRKFSSARRLKQKEITDLVTGKLPLNAWELLFVGDDEKIRGISEEASDRNTSL